ncbi:MAG: 5'-methylthioadenosine phosphorylase [Deltaproteobacteria bacterium]|nr:MAG: 5'-methylthioadenosine phosphorylase [Deltaproteobacteria bacterium]
MSVAVVVGSAFQSPTLAGKELQPVQVPTPWGDVCLYEYPHETRPGYVLFRHGLPHTYLPNQIPYRAHTHALREVGCEALLVTSSVGVLTLDVPLFDPLLVSDLLMPENRLPDGSACSMFQEPSPEHGHLVLDEGLFSKGLNEQLRTLASEANVPIGGEVVFAYVGGPRTKTSAENAFWAAVGAQVNSMTLGPEVVLANEYEIATASVVSGHKYSVPHHDDPFAQETIASSLERSHRFLEALVVAFLQHAKPVPFKNRLYRFHKD